MDHQLNIKFDQLVRAVKSLSKNRLNQLLAEIEREKATKKTQTNFEKLLLEGPVATKKQLENIAESRNAISQWRKK